MPDLDEEDAELTVKMMDISFPKYFEDKDEDGCCYWFSHSRTVVVQIEKNMKKLRICACNIA